MLYFEKLIGDHDDDHVDEDEDDYHVDEDIDDHDNIDNSSDKWCIVRN